VPVGENLTRLLPPKELGMFLSIDAHYHEVKGEVETALETYKQALVVQPDNADYRADLARYVKRLAQEGPPSFAAHAIARGLGFADEVVAAYEQRGLRSEQSGDWAQAQCAFVQGSSFCKGTTSCGKHLRRVIRKEIDARQEPQPGNCPDLRLALPHELQGTIWMLRDLALRSLGRSADALAACKEACRLWPTQPHWAQELRRFSQEQTKLKGQATPQLQAGTSPAAEGRFVADGNHGIVFTGGSVPVHASVTFCGSLLPPTMSIKPE
jgi:tetratricopeptide (TPR) repeat protein